MNTSCPAVRHPSWTGSNCRSSPGAERPESRSNATTMTNTQPQANLTDRAAASQQFAFDLDGPGVGCTQEVRAGREHVARIGERRGGTPQESQQYPPLGFPS